MHIKSPKSELFDELIILAALKGERIKNRVL